MIGSPWMQGATALLASKSTTTLTLDQRVATIELTLLKLQSALSAFHLPP